MTLQASGQISSLNIGGEFIDTPPYSINEFYRGGSLVVDIPANSTVPTSGQVSWSNFYGTKQGLLAPTLVGSSTPVFIGQFTRFNSLYINSINSAGDIAYSSTGSSWTQSNTASLSFINTFRLLGSTLVGVGPASGTNVASIIQSTNGTSWSDVPGAAITGQLYDIAYSGSRYVLVGYSTSSNLSTIQTSTSLTSGWSTAGVTKAFSNSTQILRCVHNGSIFVATGTNKEIATSSDGLTWTLRTNPFPTGTSIAGLHWANSLWVVAGYVSNQFYICTSPDGITWTQRYTSTALHAFTSPSIVSLAFGSSVWIMDQGAAVGDRYVGSVDGTNWYLMTHPTAQFNGIAYASDVSKFMHWSKDFTPTYYFYTSAAA